MSNDLVPKYLLEKMVEWKRAAKQWVPWPYQGRALKFMLENGQAGLLLDPGLGKTSISLAAIKLLLKKKLVHRVLVVAPLRAIYDVWPAEICDWKDFNELGIALLHSDYGAKVRERVLRQLTTQHQVVLINFEGLQWLCASKQRLKLLDADMLVVDECFAAGTLVTTPKGQVDIAKLKPGTMVYNELGVCKVRRVTASAPKGRVVEVRLGQHQKTIQCTEDHPFFTDLGWLPAKCLEGRRLLSLADLRGMREGDDTRHKSTGEESRKDLLSILREEVVYSQSRSTCRRGFTREDNACTLAPYLDGARENHYASFKAVNYDGWHCSASDKSRATQRVVELRDVRQRTPDTSKGATEWQRAYLLTILCEEVDLEKGSTSGWESCSISGKRNGTSGKTTNSRLEQRETVAAGIQGQSIEAGGGPWSYLGGTGWERARTFTCGDSGVRMSAEEVYLQLRSRIGHVAAWLSYQLQSRLWRSEEEISTRGRRFQPYAAQSSGCQEGGKVEGTWVESVSYLEPGSIPLVYNLEVEECPHFEVAGCALVHNSSKLKSGTTVRFRAIRKCLHLFKRRYILTGSPRPRNYLDLWGQIYLLDRGVALGQYISHYRANFFFPTGFQMREWEILPGSEEKINALVAPMVMRLDAEDYLKLPKVLERTHYVELPEAVRKEYDSIEESMMSTLFTAPLTTSASARSKLAQMANGAVYLDALPDDRWPVTKTRPTKAVHTAKVDALVDLYEELQGEPILVSIGYHHDVEAIRRALGQGIPCINGATTRTQAAAFIAAWNKGLLPMMMVHPASAGHALNLQKFSARHVCFFDIPDDYDFYDQCFRRVWRQGNKADFVMRHRIACRATVDIPKLRNLERKGTGQKAFLLAMKEYAEAKYGRIPGGKVR